MKKILPLCLSVVLVLLLLLPANTVCAADAGPCGHQATYHFDRKTKVLTISGQGPMNGGSQIKATVGRLAAEAETVVIESGITKIGDNAFADFSKLTQVRLSDTVTTIGKSAFYRTGIKEIYIPSSVTEIDSGAFSRSALEYATVPAAKVGDSAFGNCYNLKSIKFTAANVQLGTEVLIACNKLENVIFTNGVQTIPEGFVRDCKGLKGITLPQGVTNIEKEAFEGCEALIYADFPDSITSMGQGVFKNCTGLEAIKLPDKLTKLPQETFAYCTKLKRVYFPAALKIIGPRAFDGCTGLTAIKIPEGVTMIETSAFANCTALQQVAFPSTLVEIGDYAFKKSGLKAAILPDSVTVLGSQAFAVCPDLETVRFSASMTDTGKSAFQSCNKLKHVILPANIKVIADASFQYCTGLVSIHCLGDFPTIERAALNISGDNKIIFYYNAGTSGWDGKLPTSLQDDITLEKWTGGQESLPTQAAFTEPTVSVPAKPAVPQHMDAKPLTGSLPGGKEDVPSQETKPVTTEPMDNLPEATTPVESQGDAYNTEATEQKETQQQTEPTENGKENNNTPEEPDTAKPAVLWIVIAVVAVVAAAAVLYIKKRKSI